MAENFRLFAFYLNNLPEIMQIMPGAGALVQHLLDQE